MSNKSISNLPLTTNASSDDLLLLSKKDGDQYVSYSIAKENLFSTDDFLSSTAALSDINNNEIADYVKNDTIANIVNIINNLELNSFQLSTIIGEDEAGTQHTYQILLKEIQ